MVRQYATETWYDTPDAKRIRGDSAAAAVNYNSPTFFPHASAGIRDVQGTAAPGMTGPMIDRPVRNAPAESAASAAATQRAKVMKDLRNSHTEALEANRRQDEEILQGYKDRRTQIIGSLLGNSQLALSTAMQPVNQQYDKIAASNRSRMGANGLAGTTALPTMELGIERERRAAITNLTNSVGLQTAQNIASLDAGLSGDTLDYQRSVEHQYPNEQFLYELAMLEGQGSQAGLPQAGIAPGPGQMSPGLPGGVLMPVRPPVRQRKPTKAEKEQQQAVLDTIASDNARKWMNRQSSYQKTRARKATGAKKQYELERELQPMYPYRDVSAIA